VAKINNDNRIVVNGSTLDCCRDREGNYCESICAACCDMGNGVVRLGCIGMEWADVGGRDVLRPIVDDRSVALAVEWTESEGEGADRQVFVDAVRGLAGDLGFNLNEKGAAFVCRHAADKIEHLRGRLIAGGPGVAVRAKCRLAEICGIPGTESFEFVCDVAGSKVTAYGNAMVEKDQEINEMRAAAAVVDDGAHDADVHEFVEAVEGLADSMGFDLDEHGPGHVCAAAVAALVKMAAKNAGLSRELSEAREGVDVVVVASAKKRLAGLCKINEGESAEFVFKVAGDTIIARGQELRLMRNEAAEMRAKFASLRDVLCDDDDDEASE